MIERERGGSDEHDELLRGHDEIYSRFGLPSPKSETRRSVSPHVGPHVGENVTVHQRQVGRLVGGHVEIAGEEVKRLTNKR